MTEACGRTVVLILHAEGAKVYDCKTGAGGKLARQFREPVTTLIKDGKTVGPPIRGPDWEHADGTGSSSMWSKPISRRDHQRCLDQVRAGRPAGSSVMRSRIEPMKRVAKTLRRHRDLILNYFRAKKQFSSARGLV